MKQLLELGYTRLIVIRGEFGSSRCSHPSGRETNQVRISSPSALTTIQHASDSLFILSLYGRVFLRFLIVTWLCWISHARRGG
ncbi:hypothetical protein BDZ89DRAFT_697288 [Hymenopellis radicata]|nr:hypothetical protein BDZ89DRAFT_697288 [Hymenopellis radicata]